MSIYMQACSCPTPKQLQQLLLGRCPDDVADQLEKHLSDCDRCGRAVAKLNVEDPLAANLRAGVKIAEQADKALPSGLMEKLKKLRSEDTKPGENLEGESSVNGSSRDGGRDIVALLAPAQQEDELGRLGTYRVLKVLGMGGMGVVLEAEDPHLKRRVALKVMMPSLSAKETARKRFLREAQSAAALQHDHIVTIHQVGEDQGIPFLAMQLLEGESLEDRLKREGKLEVGEVLQIGKEVAEGLAAAHQKGVIHRDIKPANIWLEGPRRRVKILDFGLARVAGADVNLTKLGAIVGTPAYMAPEQSLNKPVDPRADLFSLGCVLYRICTGQLPFGGADTVGLLMSLALDEPAAPQVVNADVPPSLSDLILRLLAKNPGERPSRLPMRSWRLWKLSRRNPLALPPR
jgi:serine/threonine protein kinase